MLDYEDFISPMESDRTLAELYQQCLGARHVSGETQAACDEFFAILRPVLVRVATRVATQYGASQEIEDLMQEINLKLVNSSDSILAALPTEQPAVTAYFAVLAANCARDYFRVKRAIKRGADATVQFNDRIAGLFGSADELDRKLLMSQIEDALPHDKRESTIFRLYYRQGFTTREIASIPAFGLSVKGVESVILRTTDQVGRRLQIRKARRTAKGMANRESS